MTRREARWSTPISTGCAALDELDNLGWDEAVADAIAIVEWPERVAEALPADRLEVEIRFDPAEAPTIAG